MTGQTNQAVIKLGNEILSESIMFFQVWPHYLKINYLKCFDLYL